MASKNNSGNKKSKLDLDQYLHRHYWSDGTVEKSYSSHDEEIETKVKKIFDEGLSSEKIDYSVSNTDGQELLKFRDSLPSRGNFGTKSKTLGKSGLSQTLGEDFGYRYVKDELGYEDILHPDEKSISQGYDHLCYDPGNGDLVVVEYKGQGSDKTEAQKKVDWTATTAEKIIKGERPYKKVSKYERQFAEKMLEALERGDRVRYEVIRSYVDEKTGEFWTQLEESKVLEKEQDSDNLKAWDYLHPKAEKLENKNENDEGEQGKVNPFEECYPEYVDSSDKDNEDDELSSDNDEDYDDSKLEEKSDEKVNPFECYYPKYLDDSDQESELYEADENDFEYSEHRRFSDNEKDIDNDELDESAENDESSASEKKE
jgi:hypothetical protein